MNSFLIVWSGHVANKTTKGKYMCTVETLTQQDTEI
jgi:hypothetical protein